MFGYGVDAVSITATCQQQLKHAKEYEWYENFNFISDMRHPRKMLQQGQDRDGQEDEQDQDQKLDDFGTQDELDDEKRIKQRE